MFSNLAADTVQGAFLNLTIIADLEQYIAKVELGRQATAKKCRGIQAIVRHSSGRKQVLGYTRVCQNGYPCKGIALVL